jgi:uncharacterized protein (TIGR03437 family)
VTRQGLALLFLTWRCLCAQGLPFISHNDIPLGFKPASVVAGDFNGDGKPDLAVSSYSPNSVSVLLNKGDGTFQAPLALDAGRTFLCLAVGDFNGDGKLDLAAVALFTSNVSVLLGKGDGTFQPPLNFPVGQDPIALVSDDAFIAVGDLNGDGKPDLIVGNQSANTVAVLLGNGDGSFKAAISFAVAGTPQSLAVGDFNGDGKLDLAVATGESFGVFPLPGKDGVSVLLGKGDGSFQPAVNFAAGMYPVSLVVSDFNGDGKSDLAVANYDSNDVSVLLGKGDGTFQPAVSVAVGENPTSIRPGDFNGDGKPDLAVANYGSSNNISVLLSRGDGAFQPALNLTSGGCCVLNTDSIAVGDFNGDGKLDLALANSFAQNLSVWLGNGDGTFLGHVPFPSFTSVSSASFDQSSIVSAESIATGFGQGWGSSTATAGSAQLPDILAGTQVQLLDSAGNQFQAGLYAVYPQQISYLVPLGIAVGPATVTVSAGGKPVAEGTVKIAPVAPSLFAANANGKGPAAAQALRVTADGTQTVEPLIEFDQSKNQWVSKPLNLGPPTDQLYVLLYGTGVRGRSSLARVAIKVGVAPVPLLYAGPQNQYEGLDQINAGPLPRSLQGGHEVNVTLTVDDTSANVVTINIQ